MPSENEKKESMLHSDIARRFDVPERKAKLAKYSSSETETSKSMMDGSGQLQVYCICRSPDIERFMIMCDDCEEWFHGNCIKITEKEAKYIKFFYCKTCRAKNPFLKIKYRKNKKKEDKEREKSNKKRLKDKQKLKLKKKRSESRAVQKSASAPVLSIEQSGKGGRYEKDDLWRPDQSHTRKPSVSSERKSSIKIYSSDEDEGISISTPASKRIQESQNSIDSHLAERKQLETSDEDKGEDAVVDVDDSQPFNGKPVKEKSKKVSKRCGKCENCVRKDNCGLCDACFDRERYGAASKLQKCRLRRCLNKKSSKKSKQKTKDSNKRKSESASGQHKAAKKVKNDLSSIASSSTYASRSMLQNGVPYDDNDGSIKQCYGPGCVNAAIPPSKYCCEDCGRSLARNRLYQILPQRIQQWHSTPTVANEQGRIELERIRTRMGQAREELQALEQKFRKLESIIAAGKSLTIDEKRSDVEDESEGEADHSMYCVVCGHSISLKSAIKHMDKCYIKIESQMSFGSVYPTRIEGSQRLFCDVYNEQQQTYCKRLQVLCPEHTKEPKVAEDDVCGCPLSCDIYGANTPSKSSHFCRLAKRKCNKHFKWETMYRAEVDLQRIRQWLKIDEIFDEERRIKTAMANRAGVVSLLLHQTTVHDPLCVDMRTKPSVSKKPAYRLMI